jgi:hypothetical protein
MNKSLKEIKKFVINQMKSGSFSPGEWGRKKIYESEYLIITEEDGDILFKLNNFELKPSDIGLSKLRIYFLMFGIKRSAKLFKERVKEEMISRKWKQFLERNKDLNRDRKIDKILD